MFKWPVNFQQREWLWAAFIRPTLLASADFLRTYKLIDTIETDELGSRDMLIFRRANLP